MGSDQLRALLAVWQCPLVASGALPKMRVTFARLMRAVGDHLGGPLRRQLLRALVNEYGLYPELFASRLVAPLLSLIADIAASLKLGSGSNIRVGELPPLPPPKSKYF